LQRKSASGKARYISGNFGGDCRKTRHSKDPSIGDIKLAGKAFANLTLPEADLADITDKYRRILIDALLPTIPADAR
jgi:hypothetical protein